MNLEKMSVLSQKIEGVLGTVRTLKEENAKIKRELSQAQAMAQDKTLLLESAKHDLADCKAALDARANQANAQQAGRKGWLHRKLGIKNPRTNKQSGTAERPNQRKG